MQEVQEVEHTVRSRTLDAEAEIFRLRREHRELKARLSELNSRLHLTVDEEIERKTIQKLKLLKKDQLFALESQRPN